MFKFVTERPVVIVTIHDACPIYSKKIFRFADLLENLGINYNIAVVPFFNEKQDLPRFPKFVEQVKDCKGEIVLHGLYHEKTNGQLDDFHTRSIAITEVDIRAGLQIFQEVGISTNVFVPPRWRLSTISINILKKLGFKLAETQEKFIIITQRKFRKIHVPKVLSWDSYGDAEKNVVNVARNKRRFNRLLHDNVELIRIALHPKDPPQSLDDVKEMIVALQDRGYEALKYRQLVTSLEKQIHA
jgi:predicted deacetylase